MLRSFTAKLIVAIAATVLAGSLAAFLSSVVPDAHAESQPEGTLHQPHARGGQLPALVNGAACSSRAWPYYEQSCQFDLRRPANEVPTIRITAIR